MKNFRRAVRSALRYWFLILLSFFCSLGVAALWGANIGALFPILEVTLRGESLHAWVVDQQQQAESEITQLDQQIAALEAELAATEQPEAREKLEAKIAAQRSVLEAQRSAVSSYQSIQPWIKSYAPSLPFQTILWITGFVLVSTLIKHILLLINALLTGLVSQSVSRDLRRQVFDKALEMDRASFASYGTAGMMAQITHTTDMLGRGVMALISGAIGEPLKMLACLIGAAFISWRLLLLTLLVAPVVCLLIAFVTKRLRSISERVLNHAGHMNHVILEALNCLQTVQAYGMEGRERERFHDSTNTMLKIGMTTNFYGALTRPVIEMLGVGMIAIGLVAGSYLVLNQETHIFGIQVMDRPLGISAMLVFFGLLIGAADPVRKFSGIFGCIAKGIVAADRLYNVLDRPCNIRDPKEPKEVARPHRSIEFRDLDFAYERKDLVLKQVNLQIPFGERVAIVGANGSGKSTFVNLLCRFYDPTNGSVLLDGVDIRELTLDDLRGRIALVTQQTELFNESVRYNIAYGSGDVTEEEIIAAAQKAYAHDFIANILPDGYDTKVGQGGHRLSGGQRQRIALARALLRNPEILILDEATSQIDAESERLILQSLAEYSFGRTVIMITHREALLSLADSIIKFHKGKARKEIVKSQDAA